MPDIRSKRVMEDPEYHANMNRDLSGEPIYWDVEGMRARLDEAERVVQQLWHWRGSRYLPPELEEAVTPFLENPEVAGPELHPDRDV